MGEGTEGAGGRGLHGCGRCGTAGAVGSVRRGKRGAVGHGMVRPRGRPCRWTGGARSAESAFKREVKCLFSARQRSCSRWAFVLMARSPSCSERCPFSRKCSASASVALGRGVVVRAVRRCVRLCVWWGIRVASDGGCFDCVRATRFARAMTWAGGLVGDAEPGDTESPYQNIGERWRASSSGGGQADLRSVHRSSAGRAQGAMCEARGARMRSATHVTGGAQRGRRAAEVGLRLVGAARPERPPGPRTAPWRSRRGGLFTGFAVAPRGRSRGRFPGRSMYLSGLPGLGGLPGHSGPPGPLRRTGSLGLLSGRRCPWPLGSPGLPGRPRPLKLRVPGAYGACGAPGASRASETEGARGS